MAEEPYRCWRYARWKLGKIESKLFTEPDIPTEAEGWYDSPAKIPDGPKTALAPKTKKRRGRPPARKSDDAS